MNQGSRLNVEQLLSFSSELVKLLNQNEDINILNQYLDQSVVLKSRCYADFEQAKCAIQDFRKKIDMCKQKIVEAKSEQASDAELDLLQNELDDELKREHLIREELR
ncbi:hypothetical protein LIER_07103 [Lithospermum erythrorhizon]|uniref:Uncharacterized protein n=1 Tax=Lithospermum erythrorhizon TaxID=34254 RepID=A0AAV3P8D8_LITER